MTSLPKNDIPEVGMVVVATVHSQHVRKFQFREPVSILIGTFGFDMFQFLPAAPRILLTRWRDGIVFFYIQY